MNNNLIIVGGGIYGVVAYEVAEEMGCFEKIAFVDDTRKNTPSGVDVIGTVKELGLLACEYGNVVIAIGNSCVRLELLKKMEETSLRVVTLISPKAHISPSARIMPGCVIEPMAVVHTGCEVGKGCFISAGAVVNHYAVLGAGVHVDCNATVSGNVLVPDGTKVCSGEAFRCNLTK